MMYRLLLIIACISFQSCLFAQEIRFSGHYSNEPLERFILDIESATGIHFFFRSEWIDQKTVTVEADSTLLPDLLNEILPETGLSYYMAGDDHIILSPVRIISYVVPDSGKVEIPSPVHERTTHSMEVEQKVYPPGSTPAVIEIGDESIGTFNEEVIINGKLWNTETGEPLIGATIYFEEPGTGAVSNLDGRFHMVISKGHYNLLVNCLGMKEQRFLLKVFSDGQLNIGMEQQLIPINEVTVKSDRYNTVKSIQMGFEYIDTRTIKEIPIVMGEKDILKVATMLPGIQTVGEGSSGFNVRGSPADQNMFYINKVPVYNTSHLFGFFSSFNPDIVKDFSLYKSNIPVQFGGRLASIFDISTKQGNNTQFTARGGISPVTARLAFEGPIKKDRSSYLLSIRSTYSDWLLRQLRDPELRNSQAAFQDFAAGISMEPDENNHIRIFGYYANDRFTLGDINQYKYSNAGGSVSWNHRISPALSTDVSAVFGSYAFETKNREYISTAYTHNYQIGHYELKSDLHWIIGKNHYLTMGTGLIYYDLDRGTVRPWGPESSRTPLSLDNEHAIEGAVYFSDKFDIYPWMTLYGGFRLSYYSQLGPSTVYKYNPGNPAEDWNIYDTIHYESLSPVNFQMNPEYRLALNISTGKASSFKISYNRINQYLFMLTNTIAIAPTDQWKLCDYHIRPPKSDQISAGFYQNLFESAISASVELYYKRIRNHVEYRDGADFLSSPRIEELILQGEQSSLGAEFMLRKHSGKLSGWLSYSYSRSNVLVDGSLPWEKINQGYAFPSNYDIPHAFNLVGNFRLSRRISFSSNIVYHTGRPLTMPISTYSLEGQEFVDYSSRNKYRLPDYFRIDISCNLEGNLKSKKIAHSYWMLNVYNLTGRKNAYSIYFRSEEGSIRGYKTSIFGIPIITLSWNFKLGNYASR